jgi:hypothetical protein
MFSLSITVRGVPFHGLAALDRRRVLGLPDGNYLRINTSERRDVDEGFARLWFGLSVTGSAEIDQEFLTADDVQETERDGVRFAKTITAERVKELYVRQRFRDLEQEIAELRAATEAEGE